MKNIIPPHNVVSLECKLEDIDQIYKDSVDMLRMCHERRGRMGGAFAISHPQIERTDPLRFFVYKNGRIICNPKITRHTKTTVDSEEFCYTFFYMEKPGKVQRWNVIEVLYQELINDKFVAKKEKITGKEARVWQHELDHLDGVYVYEVDFEALEKEEREYQEKKNVEEPIVNQSIDLLQ